MNLINQLVAGIIRILAFIGYYSIGHVVDRIIRHRHRNIPTYNFDGLTYQGHPDFGALFALYPDTLNPEFLVVKETDEDTHRVYQYQDTEDMLDDYHQFQIEYADWLRYVVNGEDPDADLLLTS